MKYLLGKYFWSGLLLCLSVTQTAADTLAPEENNRDLQTREQSYRKEFQHGAQSYAEGDYVQARRYFEQARLLLPEKGASTSVIDYNLGSVCYKLNQLDDSKAYFKKLLDDKKLAAIAYYNLALIENRKGNTLTAKNYLNQSKLQSKDEKFTALVNRQLKKLKKVSVAGVVPRRTRTVKVKDWQAYLYLRSGYDSNIKFSPLDIASEQSGQFFQAIGLFDKVLAGEGLTAKKPALLFTSAVFLSNYYSTDFNDYSLYDIGLRYLFPLGHWRNSIDLNLKKSDYGHDDYQRALAATFKTKYIFSDGDIFRLRYRYETIDSLNKLYDYLEGHRHRLRAGYSFKWPEDTIFLWYEIEVNDRQNSARRNYSPTRNTERIRYEKKFAASHKAYAELEYRHSDYEATPFQDRLDNRRSYTLAYLYDLAPDWQLEAHWRFQKNRSREAVYTYDRHIVYLNLRKSF